jgi:hypothetical protein
MDKTFIKYVYSNIWGSGQFESSCIKWKALPAADRDTATHIRDFLGKKYDVYDAQQNSLHNAGVANSVQLQEILQATSDGLISVRDWQEAQDSRQEEQDSINATLLQMVKLKSSDADDTATTFSTMTSHTVVQQQQQQQQQRQQQQRRIDELEALIRSNSYSNTRRDNSGSQGGGSSRWGRGTGRDAGRGNTVEAVEHTDHGVMDQPIAIKLVNVIQMTTTAGDMALIVLTIMIYNLLFKSCRAAPFRLRKTKESAVSQQSTRLLFYIIVLFTSVNLQVDLQ